MEIEKLLQEKTEELIKHLSISGTVSTGHDDEENVYEVQITADRDAGLLIGGHGSALAAIQSFLAMYLRVETGDWVQVSVDVDGWRRKQEDQLVELARQAASRARQTGEPQNLYNLTPGERRVVHMALIDEKGVKTESKGEDRERYLVITAE